MPVDLLTYTSHSQTCHYKYAAALVRKIETRRLVLAAGTIKPTVNTYFPIHFAPGITIDQGPDASGKPQLSCKIFCAYHGTIDISSLNLGPKYMYYGIMPDQGGACAGGCGSNSKPVNNMFSVASHELAEAAI
ncbi:UNVERIFIED_CONTAM: hypothetical protein HDU68_002961 [Siphonaria sp. JEL0065]|nr:hypothetical protein HDU68_002961 [Siphonaria sp. JEL0065]